jgi:hypothetical protein
MIKQVYEEKTEFIEDYIEPLTGPLPTEIKRDLYKLKLSTIYNLGILIQRVKENQVDT